jgi:UDP-N-acetylmuramoyl-tripeptide--D-alanyl-D-alanine ligase
MIPLWTAAAAAEATDGRASTSWTATGISIDTRTLKPGDLFVALRGPNHDGNDFAAAALARGAAAAMVDRRVCGLPAGAALLRVADTLDGLRALAAAARRRSGARIVGVTGSVGKTATKEALRLVLAASGSTCASAGSLNNHWGAPLSLARMPPDAAYGVFELGMNHAGEIAALSSLLRPHVAVITNIEPAHLGFFSSVEAICGAKAEIFIGLEPGGSAVLNRDNPHYARLAAAAKRAGAAAIIGFGVHPEADVRLIDCVLDPQGSAVEVLLAAANFSFRLPVPGRHWVMNALAALGAAMALGIDPSRAGAALAALEAMPGRGRQHRLRWGGGELTLIDESYNASPAAMTAAFGVLGAIVPAANGRRVAVLGDMLELGDMAERLHRELAEPLLAAGVERVFLVGAAMAALEAALPSPLRGGWWRTADEAIPALRRSLRPDDVVTVKASHGVGIGRIVDALRAAALPGEI